MIIHVHKAVFQRGLIICKWNVYSDEVKPKGLYYKYLTYVNLFITVKEHEMTSNIHYWMYLVHI